MRFTFTVVPMSACVLLIRYSISENFVENGSLPPSSAPNRFLERLGLRLWYEKSSSL